MAVEVSEKGWPELAPTSSKYAPLHRYVQQIPAGESAVAPTFAQVEEPSPTLAEARVTFHRQGA